jgi:hypothetical protein
MPEYFLEKYILHTMQMSVFIEAEDETSGERELLPGGPETAMMYALYHRARQKTSSATDTLLRSLISHSDDNTSQLVSQITENMKGKEMSLETYITQLREVTRRLLSVRTLCRMKVEDVSEKN